MKSFSAVVMVLLSVSAEAGSSCANGRCMAQDSSLMQFKSQRVQGEASPLPTRDDGLIPLAFAVQTADWDYAGTETGVNVSFEVEGEWTEPEVLCAKADRKETITKDANLKAWPTKLKLTAGGDDAYGFESVTLKWGFIAITIVDMSEGNSTYGPGVHWIDANEDAPETVTLEVPQVVQTTKEEEEEAAHGEEGAHGEQVGPCTTKYDERVYSVGYTTSPEGTPCVFGVDPRDEGKHCIVDDGAYGSFGWCYTQESGSSWGSCDDNCPLFGQSQILGEKIDEIRENAGLTDEAADADHAEEEAAKAPAARGPSEDDAKAPAAAPAQAATPEAKGTSDHGQHLIQAALSAGQKLKFH